MLRLWFKDGTYTDVQSTSLFWYEMDPELDRIESLEGGEYIMIPYNDLTKRELKS